MINNEMLFYLTLIIILASFIQSTAGFGFALIAVPLLSNILPLQVIVPLIVIISNISNIIVIASAYDKIRFKRIKYLIVFGIIGIPFGVIMLKSVSTETLKLVLNTVIIITVFLMISGRKIKFKNEIFSYSISGFFSGILNGSISMSGPPVVLFLMNENYSKDEFRSNICFSAIIINFITIIVFVKNDLLTFSVMKITFLALFGLIIGSFSGIKMVKKLNEKYFRNIILGLLILISFINIMKIV